LLFRVEISLYPKLRLVLRHVAQRSVSRTNAKLNRIPESRPLHLRISADLQHDGSSEAAHWQLSFCSPYPRWQYRHTSSSEYAAKRVNVCASPIPCPAYLGARVESFEDSKKRRQAIKTSFMNFDYSYSHDLFFLSATRQEHARA
jgi:hypothetical protein